MKQALIVDDHPLICEAVKGLLQNAFPQLEVHVSSGGDGVLEDVCRRPWDVVVLDINLPGQNGFDILKQTRKCCADTPIIVFSLFTGTQYASRALRAGAIAYLSKECSPFDLVEVVRDILSGNTIRRPPLKKAALSNREREVLNLLGKGMHRAEIAAHLSISEKTVSTYQARLVEKLELRNAVDLIRYAIEEGLAQ
jgi:two-component system, NarL family, invasion response regulator UvrY